MHPEPYWGVPPSHRNWPVFYLTYIGIYRFNRVFLANFAKNRPMVALRALGDVTIVTAMSTLVGLELWVDQIGPQTKK